VQSLTRLAPQQEWRAALVDGRLPADPRQRGGPAPGSCWRSTAPGPAGQTLLWPGVLHARCVRAMVAEDAHLEVARDPALALPVLSRVLQVALRLEQRLAAEDIRKHPADTVCPPPGLSHPAEPAEPAGPRPASPPPFPLVLSGHAASLTPY